MLFAAALGAVGLHIADDNFLHPESGTAATGHLLSGLVPLALIAGTAACYGRSRPGLRAVLALVFGVLGVLAGTEAAYYTANGGASGDDYTGYVSVASGLLLLVVGSASCGDRGAGTTAGSGGTRGGLWWRPRPPSS